MMSCSKNVDRLSKLPEEIISHILSLMPTKFAVRTSVLCKRLRYAWTFVTNLDFYEEDCQFDTRFTEFVDSVLEHCKTSHIGVFKLHLSYTTAAQLSSVSSWIDKAVRLNVRELYITIDALCMTYELPLSLFTCNTLTKLTIDASRVGEFTCPVNLPCLKVLRIAGYPIPLGCAVKFISGSPMLESLSLEVLSDVTVKDYTFNIPTLKQLQLTLLNRHLYSTRVVLNLPNLEHLIVGQHQFLTFVIEDVSSLVEVSISSYGVRSSTHEWDELLKGISGVKSLSLGYIPSGLFLPIFPNLMRLELKDGWRFGKKIFQFLENCPELKHLHIEEYAGSGLRNPKSVPTCLLTNLTTVKFSNCKGSKFDIQFLRYILANAKALKKVIIAWDKSSIKEEAHVCARLLKRKRASKYCEIQFHGN